MAEDWSIIVIHLSHTPMESHRRPFRRLKLRTILLVALVLSGIIPLGISSLLLIPQSEEILRGSEQDNLTRDAAYRLWDEV